MLPFAFVLMVIGNGVLFFGRMKKDNRIKLIGSGISVVGYILFMAYFLSFVF